MHRRAVIRRAAAAVTVLVAAGVGWLVTRGGPDSKGAPPDVIFLTVDTLRADFMGFEGRDPSPTPHLDRLSASGTTFRQAITPMPRTTPGLASLLTGLWPHHHGSREVGEPLLTGTTLADLLRPRGYRTLAVSANSTAGPKEGLAAGFDEFVTSEVIVQKHGGRLYRDLTPAPPDGIGWAEAVTVEALHLLDSTDDDAPLFLWVLYFDPHFLYRPPSPWQDDIDAEQCWALYAWGDQNRTRAGQVFTDRTGQASAALEDCRALYEAEVAYVDHEIGRLLDGLRRRGRLEDSLVLFTADHGENLGEGGLFFEHGDNLHDAALRVPLVLSGPGVAQGRVDDEAASLVDVVPTMLSLLGWTEGERPAVDGRDLTPRLRTARQEPGEGPRITLAESATSLWNDAFQHLTTGFRILRPCLNGPRFTLCQGADGRFSLHERGDDPDLTVDVSGAEPEALQQLRQAFERWPPETARYRCARTARFKLVQSPQLEGGYAEALYDLTADPAEQRDVLAHHPREAEPLRRALHQWTAAAATPSPPPPDPERLEKLRALGYVP